MDVGLEAHGRALRGRKRYVGDVVGVVAADEGEEGDDYVGGEDEADKHYGPCTEGHCSGQGMDRSPGVVLAVASRAAGTDPTHAAYSSSFTFSVTPRPYIERNSRPELSTMARTLRSSNTVAYWRRAISSNCGCRHAPFGVGCC